MYIKFFNNKKGGSSASIKYLLNQREQEGTARTLKGDPEITKQLINSIQRKQKATVGVLSFEEANPLTEDQKLQIIEDFEKTLCPGMSKDQYNILWVEHTDKGRLELNFVIPKIELTTQKAFNPYYHKQDFARIEMFEDISNIKYDLSSKKDPAKAQTLLGSSKELNLIKDYKELDQTLLELVAAQQLRSREQLIETLKESGIEVTRAGKDYISVKMPDSKKAHKLKGGIYDQQFKSLTSLEAISETAERRAREYNSRDTQRELEATSERLNEYNEQKAQLNRAKYQLKNERYPSPKQEQIQPKSNDINITLNTDNRNIIGSDNSGLHPTKSDSKRVASAQRNEEDIRGEEVHRYEKSDSFGRKNIHPNRGKIDDSFRATIERRVREREEALQNARDKSVDDAREIQRELASTQERVRKKLSGVERRVSQIVEDEQRPLYEQAQKAMREQREQRTIRERLREAIKGFGEQLVEFKNDLSVKFFGARGELEDHKRESSDLAQSAERYKQKLERDNEPDYSYGMSM